MEQLNTQKQPKIIYIQGYLNRPEDDKGGTWAAEQVTDTDQMYINVDGLRHEFGAVITAANVLINALNAFTKILGKKEWG